MNCIYLDHNATTPVDPRVRQAMLPYLEGEFGNPSSQNHPYGWKAQMAVDAARKQVAELLSTPPKSVAWTSGATESNNLAILGLLDFLLETETRPHFITNSAEHKAVLQVFELARKRGAEISIAPVNSEGVVDVSRLRDLLQPNTRLISIMAANNEIGSINPIDAIGALCSERKIIFHTDATQAVGRIPLSLTTLKVDLLSLSAHKIYGPKGIGALVIRPVNRPFELRPLMVGGEQERSLRPGTLNVPGIVGLGAACAILQNEMTAEIEKLKRWTNQVIHAATSRPGVYLNGPRDMRLCNNVSLSLEHLHPDDIVTGLSGIAYSSGSACTSADPKPSHVLKAIGRSDALARATIRLGFGRFNTDQEINIAVEKLNLLLTASK